MGTSEEVSGRSPLSGRLLRRIRCAADFYRLQKRDASVLDEEFHRARRPSRLANIGWPPAPGNDRLLRICLQRVSAEAYLISELTATGIELVATDPPQRLTRFLIRCNALDPSEEGIGRRLLMPMARLHNAKCGLMW
jgi:hypothetical protein